MKLVLLLAGPYSSCVKTQQIWQETCTKQNIELEVIDLEHTQGQALADRLNLKSFPALILSQKVIAVGNPDKQKAEKIMAGLIANAAR
ncbi:hypothetical protein MNBD_GAMMA23-2150 [hydrothermal vent metagenome]|uniref:Thioredoxin-like fold domain-containing protein n=1 Tax=hydrothermal vent metagenome TaxID=652676 RepID=A0A3B1AG22_9ZZZZ